MNIRLSKSSQELRDEFFKLKNRNDLAELLELTTKQLNFHLYVLPEEKKYKAFTVPKKSGGTRQISAPASPIKIIQQKLKQVLESVYRPKPSTHSFVTGRSIVTNARVHKRPRYLLNIDLEDYFPSIHFGRVRGMFMGNPYHLNDEVATVLAQICCHEGVIPQGAPTSPVISNMICVHLDAKLQQLAKQHQCMYSRYADDITFSTTRPKFPSPLASLSDLGQVQIGDELASIIQQNGFKINTKKTRLQVRQQRQEVTGLTVNRYPNVPRRYIRQLRGILHAWKKYGLNTTAQRYFETYAVYKYKDSPKDRPPFPRIVLGKIEFVGMVKGKNSPVYRDLLKKFVSLTSDYVKKINESELSAVEVLILTERKTDAKHLIAALRSFQNQRFFRSFSLVWLENQGFASLESHLYAMVSQQERNTRPIVFLFDGNIKKDLYQKVGGGERYRDWGNGIYSMVLPWPKQREHIQEKSLELYYKDDDLKRKDKHGRRVFLSNEFNRLTGKHLTEDLYCAAIDKLIDPLAIIDDKVFNDQHENMALSRAEFAEQIFDQTDEFRDIDFLAFKPLFETLSMLVSDFNGQLGKDILRSARLLKVFLCYAPADEPRINEWHKRLVANGVDTWFGKEKLLPGQDRDLEIRKAVRESDAVVVWLSNLFHQAGPQQREARLAIDTAMEQPEGEIFIIPARLEECENLESLRKLQWVDLFTDDGYKKLMQALSLRAERVGAILSRIDEKPDVEKLADYESVGELGLLMSLGASELRSRNFARARDSFEKALQLSQALPDRRAEVTILANLAITYEGLGDLIRATELYEHALIRRKEIEF